MLRQLFRGHRAAIWYVVLVVLVPLITLTGLGFVALWQNLWLIPVSVTWLGLTLAGYALYRLLPEKKHSAGTAPSATESQASHTGGSDSELMQALPLRVDERPDWTDNDRRVWLQGVEAVELILANSPEWHDLPECCLDLLTTVSLAYGNDKPVVKTESNASAASVSNAVYRFTLPEILLVLSVVSSRYRQLLLRHVPFSERIKLSALLTLHGKQEHIRRGAGWINGFRRTVRLVNPLSAVIAELRDQFTNRLFTHLSDKVQNDLKRLLLQELVQVGMDLYSGRLKNSTDELSVYESLDALHDHAAQALPAEPLRVVLIGQVSAGKSSLINALVSQLQAETDVLPTTDRTTVHELYLQVEPDSNNQPVKPQIHLIDTVGLSGDAISQQTTLDAARQADLLIWVTRATQPAKAPDAQLFANLLQAFELNTERRLPPMLMVLTHIDQLSPKAHWDPPYDLRSDNPKAQTIRSALESCKKQIGLTAQTPAIPVSLANHQSAYNIDALTAQLILLLDDATQTQFNRRRTEMSGASVSWRARWEQASKLGTVTGKIVTRSILGRH